MAELPQGSFVDAFFFSVETFATVGYGHIYPDTFDGHCVATLEIIVEMFGMCNLWMDFSVLRCLRVLRMVYLTRRLTA